MIINCAPVVFLLAMFCLSPPGFAKTSPNVLFITLDDLNNDLGGYGHSMVRSPNIDQIARNGIRFERAYAQHPQCNASRSSFLAGLYPEQTGVIQNGVDFREIIPKVETLPQRLRNKGFFTARVGKIFHYMVPGQIGTMTHSIGRSLSTQQGLIRMLKVRWRSSIRAHPLLALP